MFDLFKRGSLSADVNSQTHWHFALTSDQFLPVAILITSKGKETEKPERTQPLESIIPSPDDGDGNREKNPKRVHWRDVVEEITLPTQQTPTGIKYVQLKEAEDGKWCNSCLCQKSGDRSQTGLEQCKGDSRAPHRVACTSKTRLLLDPKSQCRENRRQKSPCTKSFSQCPDAVKTVSHTFR